MIKLILILFLFQSVEQHVLYDSPQGNVCGILAVTDTQVHIRIGEGRGETFLILQKVKKIKSTYYRIENFKSKGWVVIDNDSVIIEILLYNKHRILIKAYLKPIKP